MHSAESTELQPEFKVQEIVNHIQILQAKIYQKLRIIKDPFCSISHLMTSSDDSHSIDEYQKFLQTKSEHIIALIPNLKEITGDIFESQSDMPLALFVSVDLKMNKGIALEFRRKFGTCWELQKKNRKVTDILMPQADQWKLLYIITKN